MSHTLATPQISVIIPAYNCDRYVGQAVESILNQTYDADEIIIIDDGSQDNTRQVLQPYSDYIRYVYQENQGVSVARNHGLNLARGEFIVFLDADDIFLPDKLAAQLAVFQAQPHLGLVQSGWRRVTDTGELLMDATPWDYVPELNLENWLRWKPLGTMGTLMFRREWLLKINGFEPGLAHAEDVDLILRMALFGCESAWLRQSTVCYRQHDRNTMRDGISQAKSINYVLDKFFNFPNIPLEIRLIENWVRYSTLVWSSWYLYYTGFPVEMAEYLQKSWQYTPFLLVETLINWTESFVHYSNSLGQSLEVNQLCNLPEWQNLTAWVLEQTIEKRSQPLEAGINLL
ncbi:Glycosyl transferase [Planktothrix sp. PCC 11201]|uniref:glycosyltransferase family 2 protein n=1 Tax=Planktothrix sp. PCC 11201 TaxID=1729650 RepID=UPI00091F4245|nr:glycosyltransferase family A protein [Planktothrix sp. PCC 11201]SKB15694.1 Glycosyl transferase [Planktothrix sp. PCC 11201]